MNATASELRQPLPATTRVDWSMWRILPILEFSIVIAALELDLWWIRSWDLFWPRFLIYSLLVDTVAFSTLRRIRVRRLRNERESPSRWSQPKTYLEPLLVTLVLAAGAIFLASVIQDDYQMRWHFLIKADHTWTWLGLKLVVVTAQQLGLMLFLVPVGSEIVGGAYSIRWATLISSVVFALIHLPSIMLAGLTLIAAMSWITLYQRGRRLTPLIASHLVLAVVVHGAYPERLIFDLRVGSAAVGLARHHSRISQPPHCDRLRRVTSNEYVRSVGDSDADYVMSLYRDLLNREPMHHEVSCWTDYLQGRPKRKLAESIMATEEYAQQPATTMTAMRPEHDTSDYGTTNQ